MSASSSRICFNSECREVKFERLRHGWRLRNGELSELCERCASLFEEGRFCETFHTNATGWRSCESCGKQVHCGCIVSLHAFMLLDAGGIECIQCARKNLILMSSPPWPHPSSHLPVSCDGFKDLCVKWSQIAGAGPIPWRQAPNLFNTSIAQPHRVPHEVELPTDTERCKASERLSLSSLEKRRSEDIHDKFMNGVLKLGAAEELDKGSAGMKLNEQLSSPVNIRQFPAGKDDSSTPHIGLAGPNALQNVKNGQTTAPATHMRLPSPLPSLSKQFHNSANNGVDSCGEIQMRNGRPRGDGRGKNQLLSRYLPRITDQELQKISGDSSSLITPLFEKMLSASDAGRIGRLVLPKKCAEAYFPQISQPEGLPLKVQDAKGQEWIFQFRFWPNNNSRMYVLEGVTPCIQSMQLQAGDTVTFSRLEPAGKLIMGFRKASVAPCDQGNQTNKDSNGVTSLGDGDARDPVNTQSKFDKPGDITKEATGTKALVPRKRKSGILGSKTKRHKVENMDLIELKITWDEAQTLLRPPTNHVPTVVIIEGFQFEEYEDAPVIGKPSFLANDHSGEKIQWVQCEDCFKWRKLPSDALLPFKWACSENLWDSARSSCSAAQELTEEQLVKLLSASNPAASKKMKAAKQDPDIEEALEGLDTLANLAIMEEGGEASAQAATTKHPRHRPGCSCIVCIQPPSGKGPKHLQSCTCNVCLTVRRRFRTLMMRRERKQTEKEAETARKNKREQSESPENDDSLLYTDMGNSSSDQKEAGNEGSDNDPKSKRGKSMDSPFKGQIDLNMQPEREEELSPSSDSGSMMRLLQDATDRYLRQQRLLSSRTTLTGERDEGQVSRERVCDSVIHGNSLDADLGQPVTL